MNDELQKALAAIINKTIGAMDASVNFLQAELPEVIRQLLLWKAVQSCIQFCICLAVFAAFATATVKFLKAAAEYKTKGDYDDNIMRPLLGIISGGIATIMIFVVGCNLEWLQIMIAPKVYLVEYAAYLTKK